MAPRCLYQPSRATHGQASPARVTNGIRGTAGNQQLRRADLPRHDDRASPMIIVAAQTPDRLKAGCSKRSDDDRSHLLYLTAFRCHPRRSGRCTRRASWLGRPAPWAARAPATGRQRTAHNRVLAMIRGESIECALGRSMSSRGRVQIITGGILGGKTQPVWAAPRLPPLT